MKKIYVNKNKGFCIGVKNAIRLATECNDDSVFSYGPLVHNKGVVGRLAEKNITVIEDLSQLKTGDTLIIRAHGAPKSVYEECSKKRVKVIDATCPFVRKIQIRAEQYYNDGYKIVLFGNEKHPEIVGINGWCGNSALVTDGTQIVDLREFPKVLVMFQTTFTSEKVDTSLKNLLTDGVKMLVVFNTICYTTIDRQSFARQISPKCDLAIVIGDKQSSNTTKLYQIACNSTAEVIWIERAEELPSLHNYEKICIIAGASTPQELTEEVLSKMFAEAKDNAQVVEVNEEFAQAVDKLPAKRTFRKGQRIKGIVIQKHDDGVSVTIPNSKGDGFIPNDELTVDGDYEKVKAELKVGDAIECTVLSTEKRVTLSKKEIDILYKDDEKVEGIRNGEIFELVMTKAVKGGLLSKLGSYTVFVPASQIKNGFVKNLEQYENKKLRLVALPDGVDDNKHKIVASQREILNRERQEKEDNFWNNIAVNEIVEGKVLRFAPFGAFVNVRGFDCLAHLSDLSWNPIKDPAEVLELNKTYDFVVLKLDRASNRVSIGYKQLQERPWVAASVKFPVGSVVKGKVARILPFGAFVQIDDGIDGLLHISNVSWEWLGDINEALKVGDEIDVAILEFDADNKRVTLSRKATMEKPDDLPRRNNKHNEDNTDQSQE